MNNHSNNNNQSNNGNHIPVTARDGNPQQEMSIKYYLGMLWRGKWFILVVTLIVFNVVLYLTMQEEPVYQAETSVMLNIRGKETALLPAFVGDVGKNIRNELQLLQSRSLAYKVAERLVEKRYVDEEKKELLPIITYYENGTFAGELSAGSVSGRVRGRVTFTNIPNSDIIVISAKSSDPREAAIISNTYARAYYERNLQLSRSQTGNVKGFLEAQLREKEESLHNAERRLQQYMEDHGVVLMDAESRRVVDQVSQLEARKEELQVEIRALKNSMASVQGQLEEQEPGIARNIGSADNPYIQRLQQQIAEAEVARDMTLAQNPAAVGQEQYERRLKEIEGRLANLRESLAKRTDEFLKALSPGDEGFLRGLKQRLLEGQIELQGLELRLDATTQRLAQYEQQFDQLPGMSVEYARLQRARQSSEQLYLFIEQRYNEAIIAEQSEFGIVDIIDSAVVPSRPVSPDVPQNLTFALVFGLGLGFVFVFVKELLSTKVKTPEDLKKNGFIPLTTISLMNKDIKNVSSKGKIAILGRSLDAHIISIANPLSPITESIRWLRTNLQYVSIDKPVRSIVISSPGPGEGKSTIAANLAVVYAQSNKRVILIDADMRNPSVHEGFDHKKSPGLTEMIFGELTLTDAIQRTVVDNLDILTAGKPSLNPSELLGSEKMRAVIKTLQEMYDIVIIDTPPVLVATDPNVLAPFVDGVVLVASADQTKVEELKAAQESMETVHAKLFGVVLNKFDLRQSYGYGYSYGYKYYKYGKYGNGEQLSKKQKRKAKV